jgi:hypothetical protein
MPARSFDPTKTPWTPVVVVVLLFAFVVGSMVRSRLASRPGHLHRATTVATVSLSAEARARLQPHMKRHADDMRALTDAVAALDHRRAAAVAVGMLADPALEPVLRPKTEALLEAARSYDNDRLVAADAELAWTCAQCHTTFAGP